MSGIGSRVGVGAKVAAGIGAESVTAVGAGEGAPTRRSAMLHPRSVTAMATINETRRMRMAWLLETSRERGEARFASATSGKLWAIVAPGPMRAPREPQARGELRGTGLKARLQRSP
jgi:hypothetical protein